MMKNIFFFKIEQIQDDTSLFDEFKEKTIFFSYFKVNPSYYIFLYAQKSIDINFLYRSINVIQELDSKKRRIRSLRGFFLYALEIMENGKDSQILKTNLQPFFWRKVKNILGQNKKEAISEFLFGKEAEEQKSSSLKELQKQVNSLQERIVELENQNLEED